jgi:hypothetical protein
MAITLEANYSKKLGLLGYSSHQYSVTVRTELSDLSVIDTESRRLYGLLQASVDRELQTIGFLPSNGSPANKSNGNGHGGAHPEAWRCTDKQRGLILDLTERHHLDKNAVEALAQDRFGKGVRQLNKLEASGLIDALMVQTGAQPAGPRIYRGSRAPKAGVR